MDTRYQPGGDGKPRRGRPPKHIAQQRAEAAETPNPRSAKSQTSRRRRRRESLGDDRNMKLFVPEHQKDDNYVYRWINDTAGGRIYNKTKEDDWEVVEYADDQAPAAGDVGEGQQIKRIVGGGANGQPLYAYLCRKPREFCEEDYKAEQAKIDEVENQLRRGGPNQGQSDLPATHAYVPAGGNQISTGD